MLRWTRNDKQRLEIISLISLGSWNFMNRSGIQNIFRMLSTMRQAYHALFFIYSPYIFLLRCTQCILHMLYTFLKFHKCFYKNSLCSPPSRLGRKCLCSRACTHRGRRINFWNIFELSIFYLLFIIHLCMLGRSRFRRAAVHTLRPFLFARFWKQNGKFAVLLLVSAHPSGAPGNCLCAVLL